VVKKMNGHITQYSIDDLRRSRLGFHVGNGKMLYAVCVEHVGGPRRTWRTEMLYFGAATVEDLRAELCRGVLTFLPSGSRIVAVAPAIGMHHDERGEELVA